MEGNGAPPRPPQPPRRLPLAIRIGLGLLALGMVFSAVLVLELLSADEPTAGSELLASPTPLLPAEIRGYGIRPEPEISAALQAEYDRRSFGVERVEAAAIPLRRSAASLFGATLEPDRSATSREFRAAVLRGAAGGLGIDLERRPFRFTARSNVAIYETGSDEGRLFVWFFRDAFVQLFVPAAIAAEGDEIQRVVLQAQTSAAERAAATPSP